MMNKDLSFFSDIVDEHEFFKKNSLKNDKKDLKTALVVASASTIRDKSRTYLKSATNITEEEFAFYCKVLGEKKTFEAALNLSKKSKSELPENFVIDRVVDYFGEHAASNKDVMTGWKKKLITEVFYAHASDPEHFDRLCCGKAILTKTYTKVGHRYYYGRWSPSTTVYQQKEWDGIEVNELNEHARNLIASSCTVRFGDRFIGTLTIQDSIDFLSWCVEQLHNDDKCISQKTIYNLLEITNDFLNGRQKEELNQRFDELEQLSIELYPWCRSEAKRTQRIIGTDILKTYTKIR